MAQELDFIVFLLCVFPLLYFSFVLILFIAIFEPLHYITFFGPQWGLNCSWKLLDSSSRYSFIFCPLQWRELRQ